MTGLVADKGCFCGMLAALVATVAMERRLGRVEQTVADLGRVIDNERRLQHS